MPTDRSNGTEMKGIEWNTPREAKWNTRKIDELTEPIDNQKFNYILFSFHLSGRSKWKFHSNFLAYLFLFIGGWWRVDDVRIFHATKAFHAEHIIPIMAWQADLTKK